MLFVKSDGGGGDKIVATYIMKERGMGGKRKVEGFFNYGEEKRKR